MIFRRHLRCAKTTIATLRTPGVNNTCLPPFLAQRTRKGDLPMFQMRLFAIFSLQSPTVRKKNPQPGPKVSPVVLTNNAYEEQYFIPVLYRYQVPEQHTDHGSLCGSDTKGNIHAFVRTTMSAAMRPPPRAHTHTKWKNSPPTHREGIGNSCYTRNLLYVIPVSSLQRLVREFQGHLGSDVPPTVPLM